MWVDPQVLEMTPAFKSLQTSDNPEGQVPEAPPGPPPSVQGSDLPALTDPDNYQPGASTVTGSGAELTTTPADSAGDSTITLTPANPASPPVSATVDGDPPPPVVQQPARPLTAEEVRLLNGVLPGSAIQVRQNPDGTLTPLEHGPATPTEKLAQNLPNVIAIGQRTQARDTELAAPPGAQITPVTGIDGSRLGQRTTLADGSWYEAIDDGDGGRTVVYSDGRVAHYDILGIKWEPQFRNGRPVEVITDVANGTVETRGLDEYDNPTTTITHNDGTTVTASVFGKQTVTTITKGGVTYQIHPNPDGTAQIQKWVNGTLTSITTTGPTNPQPVDPEVIRGLGLLRASSDWTPPQDYQGSTLSAILEGTGRTADSVSDFITPGRHALDKVAAVRAARIAGGYGKLFGPVGALATVGSGAIALANGSPVPETIGGTAGALVGGTLGAAAGAGIGTSAGIATAAAIGATAGSIVPGLGTAIGAGIGAGIGALSGRTTDHRSGIKHEPYGTSWSVEVVL